MNHRALLTSLAIASFHPLAIAQSTWTVDIANGPGTDFTEIDDALAAISPGDTLLVRNGIYRPFTVTRGVRIIADGVARVNAGFNVRDVPAGETVALRDLHPSTTSVLMPVGISIRDNAGSIQLHGIRIHTFHTRITEIVNSNDVSCVDCTLNGTTVGLRATNSTVRLDNCTVGIVQSLTGNDYALHCIGSNVTIGGASVVSGAPQRFFTATSAIQLDSGTITVGAASTVRAGAGGASKPAIQSVAGTIIFDPTAFLLPHVGVAPVSGNATVVERPVPSIRTDNATAGGQFAGTIFAAPGSTVLVFIGVPSPRVPTVFGDLWVAGPITPVAANSISGIGELSFQLTSGATTPDGFSLTMQAIVLRGQELRLSTASTPVFKR